MVKALDMLLDSSPGIWLCCFTVILQAVKSHLPNGELWLFYLWHNSNVFYVSDPLPNFLNVNINFLS